eukprot:4827420-Prymnesium_polylepis.1
MRRHRPPLRLWYRRGARRGGAHGPRPGDEQHCAPTYTMNVHTRDTHMPHATCTSSHPRPKAHVRSIDPGPTSGACRRRVLVTRRATAAWRDDALDTAAGGRAVRWQRSLPARDRAEC